MKLTIEPIRRLKWKWTLTELDEDEQEAARLGYHLAQIRLSGIASSEFSAGFDARAMVDKIKDGVIHANAKRKVYDV